MTALIRLASLSEVAKAKSKPVVQNDPASLLEAVKARARRQLTKGRSDAGKRPLSTDPRVWSSRAQPIPGLRREGLAVSSATVVALRALLAEMRHQNTNIPRSIRQRETEIVEMIAVLEAHARWLTAVLRPRPGPSGWQPLTAFVAEVGAPLLPGPDGKLRIGEDLDVADLVAASILAGLLTRADLQGLSSADEAFDRQERRVKQAIRRLTTRGTRSREK